ncbi:MAG: DEAD/DEAH box helicase [Candidatus Kariarchaeaceae archaeon]
MSSIKIKFDRGYDLIVETERLESIERSIPEKKYRIDEKSYHLPPYLYKSLIELLENEKLDYSIDKSIPTDFSLGEKLVLSTPLRPYQDEALNTWFNEKKGIIILPTGSGKTIVGLAIIAKLNLKTIILVPTINLLYQWQEVIKSVLSINSANLGQLGDGISNLQEITVSTYDSARLKIKQLRQEFGLIIADECHHLAAPTTSLIAKGMIASARVGLTATPREDDLGKELIPLLGPLIKTTTIAMLQDKGFMAELEHEIITVEPLADEWEEYQKAEKTYRKYLTKHNIAMRSPKDFERLIFRVNRDPEAKKALDAHRRARVLSFGSKAKLQALKPLLELHSDDRVIIFSEFTNIVNEVSRTFLIPAITHETLSSERNAILSAFHTGEITKIVAGKVLDEGWDCPDARIGVILSGTRQQRQYIQRLGRILRPKIKNAILYQIITKGSREVSVAKDRTIDITKR